MSQFIELPEQQLVYLNENNEIILGDELILDETLTFNVVPVDIEVINVYEVESLKGQPDQAPTAEDVVSANKLGELSEDKIEPSPKVVKSRKIVRNPSSWKSSIRKSQCQAGEEYLSVRGKVVPKKAIQNKKDCLKDCAYNCATKVMKAERQAQFNAFYILDVQRKQDFILKTTERHLTARKTKKGPSRRNFSFSYFIEVAGIRHTVCKQYYLGTFDISQSPIYTAHKNKCDSTGTAQQNMRGRTSNNKISDERLSIVMQHINSFPRIESHYCRAKTTRQYLEPNLNISKMYELYKEQTINPVKESYYRFIFCTKFNIGFHTPKSDRCGMCEKHKAAEEQGMLTIDLTEEKEKHLKLKNEMREQKTKDKEGLIPILCFDLQNVLNCPRAEIGPMFYYSKLNIYNLTAYLSPEKKTYCCIWTEYSSGRTGNDIASAFVKILNRVLDDYPEIHDIITWSDSCVPQNKNSIMATAILNVFKKHPYLNSVSMKYSIAGHGAIQEVDKIHSDIEKVLAVNEYFSPMGLIRILKTVNRKNPPVVMQMSGSDFKDFGLYSKMWFDFSTVPFSKLRILKFSQQIYEIQYSLDYSESNVIDSNIRRKERTKKLMTTKSAEPEIMAKVGELSEIKKKHLQQMFAYMTPADIQYYKVILKLNGEILGDLNQSGGVEESNEQCSSNGDPYIKANCIRKPIKRLNRSSSAKKNTARVKTSKKTKTNPKRVP